MLQIRLKPNQLLNEEVIFSAPSRYHTPKNPILLYLKDRVWPKGWKPVHTQPNFTIQQEQKILKGQLKSR